MTGRRISLVNPTYLLRPLQNPSVRVCTQLIFNAAHGRRRGFTLHLLHFILYLLSPLKCSWSQGSYANIYFQIFIKSKGTLSDPGGGCSTG